MPSCLVSWHKKNRTGRKTKKLAQLKSFSSVSSCHKQRQVLLYLKPLKLAKLFAIDKFGLARPRVISWGFCQDPRTTKQQPGLRAACKGRPQTEIYKTAISNNYSHAGCVCVCVVSNFRENVHKICCQQICMQKGQDNRMVDTWTPRRSSRTWYLNASRVPAKLLLLHKKNIPKYTAIERPNIKWI